MKVYTQAELEGMSDLAINKIIGKRKGIVKGGKTDSYYDRHCPNYCNNWSDCGDLIDELNEVVDLTVECDLARIETGEGGRLVRSSNNKRAVTIVYILIKQGE